MSDSVEKVHHVAQCRGKTPYDSKAAAREVIQRIARRKRDNNFRIYKCVVCGKFHFGHNFGRRAKRPTGDSE